MIDRTPNLTTHIGLTRAQLELVEPLSDDFAAAVKNTATALLQQTKDHFPTMTAREAALFSAAIGTASGNVLLTMART